eukprot:TRINITY_DN8152_c0_g1_i1.p2 TRINITY_DN8152_c0_g1~~TRINITY_DN8152_c0_g1_i1.p2  ORF type:complete len:113 (+),score=13.36 TRINITY_DN8152_c0_g1_i1:55-393(+)
MAIVSRSFAARGKVQRVMFRQTLIRAAQSRKLKAGASNIKTDKSLVHFTLVGEQSKIEEITTFMQSGRPLNSWGATVTSLESIPDPSVFSNHQVTTDNVDKFNWNPNVTMYL